MAQEQTQGNQVLQKVRLTCRRPHLVALLHLFMLRCHYRGKRLEERVING